MPLPFTDSLQAAHLRGADSITFDPLGVAAILGNPRADLSAARLYAQADRATFRWPHGTMIGGALTPISTLVSHLAQYESIHPAVAMCTKDEISISVLSDTIFREFRINVMNLWLRDILNFRPSHERGVVGSLVGGGGGRAANDIAIVLAQHVFDHGILPPEHPARWGIRLRKLIISLTGYTTGLFLCVGLIFSVLTGDFWGVALFFCYVAHWFASTLVSWTSLVKTVCPKIRQDNHIHFAVHERPTDIGGTVIFKGSQQDLETWYRTTLHFRHGIFTDALHWYWVVTGSLSAIASVACMVNMTARFQLAFLGVLAWSSLAELWVTQSARRIQREVREAASLGKAVILTENKTRTAAITRATLGVTDECSLKGLDWVGLKLLPNNTLFVEYQRMINSLAEDGGPMNIEKAIGDFRNTSGYEGLEPKNRALIDRIVQEVTDVMDLRKPNVGAEVVLDRKTAVVIDP